MQRLCIRPLVPLIEQCYNLFFLDAKILQRFIDDMHLPLCRWIGRIHYMQNIVRILRFL